MLKAWINTNPKNKFPRITNDFKKLSWIMQGLQERIPRIKCERTVCQLFQEMMLRDTHTNTQTL
jgi:hypothetical protein